MNTNIVFAMNKHRNAVPASYVALIVWCGGFVAAGGFFCYCVEGFKAGDVGNLEKFGVLLVF